jgi:hypothetical protein
MKSWKIWSQADEQSLCSNTGTLVHPLVVVAALLEMPMQAIFWALGVNDQYMSVCHSAGEELRARVKAMLEAK